MNKFTQRILVAYDVQLQTRRGVYKPRTGEVIGNTGAFRNAKPIDKEWHELSGEQVQNMVQNVEHCEVCADGALFLSQIRLFDGVNGYAFVQQLGSCSTMKSERLVDLFGKELLNDIEYVFEGKSYPWHYVRSDEQEAKLQQFRQSILETVVYAPTDDEDARRFKRLNVLIEATMQRLIDNDGFGLNL